MKKLIHIVTIMAVIISGLAIATVADAPQAVAYSNTRLMDDQVFDNKNTMNEGQIQAFLASKGPCLANYQDVNPNWNGSSWTYTGSVSAAHIIARASQEWGINPQVIMATLQKESSLVAGTNCDGWRYNSAMGYGCPDSGSCNPTYAGFTRQVWWGSWQLKFNKERSYGNTGWNGDSNITYGGFMTQGTFKRCGACSAVYYSGDITVDGQPIHLENGTTASLYTYTPHLGQAFPGIFESWFGSATAGNVLSSKLYRLYKRSTDRHFYSTSIQEVNTAMGHGYALEGVAYYVSVSGGSGLAPVFRLYNKSSDYHFYTIDNDEANRDTGIGFTREGTGFFASHGGDPGVAPVYRLVHTKNGTHFFTINSAERDNAVRSGSFRFEGIAFFAVPN